MKKNMLTKLLAVSLSAAVAVGAAGCGGSDAGEAPAGDAAAAADAQEAETSDGGGAQDSAASGEADYSVLEGKTISFMTSQGKYFEEYQTMADAIKADYGCTVEFQVIPDDEYMSVTNLKLSTEEVPDVFELNVPSQNVTTNVYEYCEDLSNEPWVERLVNPELLKDRKDGKIYGLPKESSSGYQAVYYNKKILADCGIENPMPKTYDEFLEILKTVKEKSDVTPFLQTNADNWTTQIFMTGGIPIALGDKAAETYEKLLGNEMKWTDIPEATTILQNYVNLFSDGYVNADHLSIGYDDAAEIMGTGKAAMYLTIEQWASDMNAKYPDVEFGSFAIPHADTPNLPTGDYVQGLLVPKAGKQADVAKVFLQVWSMPKYQNLYWEVNPGFPAFNDVDGGDVVQCVQDVVDNYITTGNYTYEINGQMADANGSFNDLWNFYVAAAAGDMTPEEVFSEFQTIYVDFMQQQGYEGF